MYISETGAVNHLQKGSEMNYDTLLKKTKALSVREFARLAKISPTTASRIKRGETPDHKTLTAMCNAFDVKQVTITINPTT